MNDRQTYLVEQLQKHHPQHAEVTFADLLGKVSVVIPSHEEFADKFLRIEFDFIYDHTTSLYLAEIDDHHVRLLAALYGYWTGKPVESVYDASTAYVEEGLGMLKSRASHHIIRGASFVVPAALSRVARDIKVLE